MKKNKKRIWIRIVAFCMSLVIAACSTAAADNVEARTNTKLKVHFIDVGCGDSILIQYGSGAKAEYGMIDAGPVYYTKTNKKKVDTSNRARNYLKKQKITHLKFVLLTHPNQDHIGGMIKILDDPKIKIDTIYGNDFDLKVLQSSKNKNKQSASTAKLIKYRDDEGIYAQVIAKIQKKVKQKETTYVVPKAGDKVYLGNACLTFYGVINARYKYARRGDLNYRQVNKYSIVTRLTYKKNSFLFTGDAQKETIEQLVKKGYNLQAQVLKVPHHGMQDILKDSKKARSDHRYLFKKVKAKTAIISNGYKNSYKAPHKKTLNELKSADVYDTGSRGTIVVTSDGKRLSVKVQKKKGPSYKKTRKGKK